MMSITRSRLLAAMAALVPAGAAFAADVHVRQLDWIGPAGFVDIPFSRIVDLEFSFDLGDPQDLILLGDGGFVNVVTADGEWAVQNLHLFFVDPMEFTAARPSVMIGLAQPNGIPLNELALGLSVTPESLDAPPLVDFTPHPVETVVYHTGGIEGGGSGLSIIPDTLAAYIGPPPFLIFPDMVAFTDPMTPIRPVNEEINGCAPASAARSIQYMGQLNGFGTDPIQMIYNDLKGTMGTTVGPGSNGTFTPNFLTGKDQYVDEENLPIDTIQTLNGFTMADLCAAADAIVAGGDVEILIEWEGGGGHAAMIKKIVKWPDGSATITYVDDPAQGDGMAQNKDHVIHVQPDGTFPGGLVKGFQIETIDPCPADLDGDGMVGFNDLLALLAVWGDCPGPGSCEPDLDGNGDVGFSDLLAMLTLWGPCP